MQFALRGGEEAEIRGENLVAAGYTYALRDIVWVGLVVDPATAVPGAPPNPAVGIQMRDGSHAALAPADPPDAWRLLGAIHEARPDLRGPVPPPPGAQRPGMQPPSPYGYPPYAPQSAASNSDNILAGLAHLSVFFAPLILPLVVWLAMRKSSPYVSRQGKQAFFFHLFFSALGFVTFIVIYVGFFSFAFSFSSSDTSTAFDGFSPLLLFFGVYAILGVLSLVQIVYSIIGAVQAFQGKPFHYPLLGWL
jgi:uncharacterized Tic20 family protein